MSEPKLVLVSNRIPITFTTEDGKLKGVPSSGGLVSALEPLLKDHGGIWVGSGGTEESPEIRKILERASGETPYKYAPLFLTEEEQSNFYEGVNRKFADAVERSSCPGDLIWIHDYQLMQVGKSLRHRRPNARLAFFLHIPFPSPDIFAKLPWRQQILEDLLAHDLVGVQTGRDQRNLIACLRSFVPSVTISGRGESRMVISAHGHTHVEAFPISIDFRAFSEQSESAPVVERAKQIIAKTHDIQITIGVDRLDYTKGIPERIKAFGNFLRNYPQFHRKVELIQIVV